MSKKESVTREYLSDAEVDKINTFVHDKSMVEAVKKVLLASMYQNGTLRKDVKPNSLTNGALALVAMASSGRGVVSNEELGQDLRGLFHGIQLLESGFNELNKLKVEVDGVESQYNNEAL